MHSVSKMREREISIILFHLVIIISGLAQSERCSGDSIPQVGYSGVEHLSSTVGQSAEFNIA